MLATAVTAKPGGPLQALRSRIRGAVLTPEDPGYDQARAAWNPAVQQRPLLAVMAETEGDIARAVEYASEVGLGVAVQATGHGVTVPATGGVLVNTSRMRSVNVGAGTAIVGPGAIWADVLPHTQEFGLAPLLGSSSGVGVVGYTLGGGSGFLGRQYGLAADSVVRMRAVTADGRVLNVTAEEHPDLFWAMRGGTSNFGVVTRLEFKLYPVKRVCGGGVYWPIERAREVSDVYREWTAAAPESVTSRLALLRVPPLPHIPNEMWGKLLVAVQAAFLGDEEEGARLFAPFRKLGAPVVEDALGMMPFAAAPTRSHATPSRARPRCCTPTYRTRSPST